MKKLTAFVLLSISTLCLSACGKGSSSVGIIGGADGPTVISVASNTSWPSVCVFIGIAVAVSVLIFIIYRNKKSK